MAALTTGERKITRNQLIRDYGFPGLTKPDILAALDATDTWINDNQGSFNTALPDPFKSTASLTLKTLLFCYVAMRRAGILKAEED